jgi:hypothetical protein
MKKFTLLMLFCILTSLQSQAAFSNFTVNETMYLITSPNTVEITDTYHDGSSETLEIPATVNYEGVTYTVTAIYEKAFFDKSFKSVILPNTLKEIEDYAFMGCEKLQSIDIPESVKKIGIGAFKDCTSLTKVMIPKSVEELGFGAFCSCTNLEEFTFETPCSLKSFTDYFDYSKVKTVTIPNSVKEIISMGNCENLESVHFESSSSVEKIDVFAFYYCPNLSTIDVPESVKWVDQDALTNTKWLANQSDGLVYVGKCAYKYKGTMPAATKIDLKDGTASLGCSCFQDCKTLISLKLPETLTRMGLYALSGCANLTDMTLPTSFNTADLHCLDDTPWYSNQPDGVVYAGKAAYAYKGSIPSDGHIDIKEGTESLTFDLFKNKTELVSVTLPASLVNIYISAFYGCTNLKNVSIPYDSKLEYLGADIFDGCDNLNSFTIPSSVRTIDQSFKNSGLTSLNIPESVTSIKREICHGCKKLQSVAWPTSISTIPFEAFEECTSLKSFTIPETVTKIDSRAFCDCTALENIEIPKNVRDIEEWAFVGCSSLKNVKWNAEACLKTEYNLGWRDKHSKNGQCAFYGIFGVCPSLTDLEIGENVKYIPLKPFKDMTALKQVTFNTTALINSEYNTFEDCSSFTDLKIGKNVSRIGRLFYDCTSLQKVIFETSSSMHIFDGLGNDVNLTQINLPENVDSICGCAFWGCRSLTSIKIPSNVKTLGNNTFENCSSLRRITLPSNLIYIESAPFNGCTSLDSLNIPSTVKEIEYSSFDGCTGLKDLFCYPETPPTVISNGFSSDVTSVCKLHVPSNVLSLYKQDYYWSKFYNISGDLQSTGISAINSDCNVVKTEYYSLDGKLMDDAAKGPMLERQYLSNGKVVSRKIVK